MIINPAIKVLGTYIGTIKKNEIATVKITGRFSIRGPGGESYGPIGSLAPATDGFAFKNFTKYACIVKVRGDDGRGPEYQYPGAPLQIGPYNSSDEFNIWVVVNDDVYTDNVNDPTDPLQGFILKG